MKQFSQTIHHEVSEVADEHYMGGSEVALIVSLTAEVLLVGILDFFFYKLIN